MRRGQKKKKTTKIHLLYVDLVPLRSDAIPLGPDLLFSQFSSILKED